jgi:hypothetical protein
MHYKTYIKRRITFQTGNLWAVDSRPEPNTVDRSVCASNTADPMPSDVNEEKGCAESPIRAT